MTRASSIVSNSLASTDEPMVHFGYRRYRRPMLEAGVDLYELSGRDSWRVNRVADANTTFGLHTKCVVFDRDTVYIGSLNFDPRSEKINTEVGLLIRSEELAEDIIEWVEEAKRKALYRVKLADRTELVWDASLWDVDPHVRRDEPSVSAWRRFWLELLGPMVPESLL